MGIVEGRSSDEGSHRWRNSFPRLYLDARLLDDSAALSGRVIVLQGACRQSELLCQTWNGGWLERLGWGLRGLIFGVSPKYHKCWNIRG